MTWLWVRYEADVGIVESQSCHNILFSLFDKCFRSQNIYRCGWRYPMGHIITTRRQIYDQELQLTCVPHNSSAHWWSFFDHASQWTIEILVEWYTLERLFWFLSCGPLTLVSVLCQYTCPSSQPIKRSMQMTWIKARLLNGFLALSLLHYKHPPAHSLQFPTKWSALVRINRCRSGSNYVVHAIDMGTCVSVCLPVLSRCQWIFPLPGGRLN